MSKKIKIFYDDAIMIGALEQDVNFFISDEKIETIDIKYNISTTVNSFNREYTVISVMIVYRDIA